LFGIGTGELVLIFIVIFLIYGPSRLPELARSLGKMARDVRKATDDVKAAVTQETDKIKDLTLGAGETPDKTKAEPQAKKGKGDGER